MLAVLVQTRCTLSSGLKAANPEDVGLTWQECVVTSFDWKEAETCFGHSMPLRDERERGNFADRLGDLESLQLKIGQDVYRAVPTGSIFAIQRYTLYRNDKVVRSLYGRFTAYSPNVSLQNVDGKAVWEFSDGETATIIYDSRDVRQFYRLDRAYRPYGLGGKLIFIGQKDDRYLVVYDGWKIGPDFERVYIAYCCEPVLWSVQFGQNKYLFWGDRGGQKYIVEVSLREE